MKLAVYMFIFLLCALFLVGPVSASQVQLDLKSLATSEACKAAQKEAD